MKNNHVIEPSNVLGHEHYIDMAGCVGDGVHKRLTARVSFYVDRVDAVYVVLNKQKTAYSGTSLEAAVAAYNAI